LRRSKAVRARGFRLGTRRRGAWFRVERVIRRANTVLEVLDSRDPLGTRNLELEKLARRLGKRLLLVLNKADLVPRRVLDEWIGFFKSKGYTVFPVSAKRRRDLEVLGGYVREAAGRRRVVLAVVGYPNVGKSTIINGLKGRRVAETSPIPGFTRGEKMVRVDDRLLLVDTPGVLPIKRGSASSLVLRGFISPEKLRNPVSPAVKLLEDILDSMPNLLKETYGIEGEAPDRFLEDLAAKRGFLLKGGELNVEEAARLILQDWQTGKLRFYRSLSKEHP